MWLNAFFDDMMVRKLLLYVRAKLVDFYGRR